MSIPEVAEYFGINPRTVRRALCESDRKAVAHPNRGDRSAGEADFDKEMGDLRRTACTRRAERCWRIDRLALEQIELAERPACPSLAEPHCGRSLTLPSLQRRWLLEQAVGLLDPRLARLEHTRALVDLGSMLRRINRRAAARDPLRPGA